MNSHLRKRFLFFVLLLLVSAGPISAQTTSSSPPLLRTVPPASLIAPTPSTPCAPTCLGTELTALNLPGPRTKRLVLVTGGLAASYTGQFLYEKQLWWNDESARFHFHSQLNYSRNFDKLAHLYAGQAQALINARLFEWSGMRRSRAAFWGSLTSLLAQTHVEIHDGFHRKWGFDWYDQAANVLGATWFYAREHVEPLQRFTVRWTYAPSKLWRGDTPQSIVFADDYSGHTYWVSMRLWDLLPPATQEVWPSFLQVSAGATLNDWSDETWARNHPGGPGPDPDAYVSYYLSLDLDWNALLPQDTWLGRFASDVLNRVHLPAPAVRIFPHPHLHLLFIGQN